MRSHCVTQDGLELRAACFLFPEFWNYWYVPLHCPRYRCTLPKIYLTFKGMLSIYSIFHWSFSSRWWECLQAFLRNKLTLQEEQVWRLKAWGRAVLAEGGLRCFSLVLFSPLYLIVKLVQLWNHFPHGVVIPVLRSCLGSSFLSILIAVGPDPLCSENLSLIKPKVLQIRFRSLQPIFMFLLYNSHNTQLTFIAIFSVPFGSIKYIQILGNCVCDVGLLVGCLSTT